MEVFFMFDHDHSFLAGRLIDLLLHRHPFDDVVEFDLARLLRKDRHVVRVPLDEGLALLHFAAVRHGDD